jgi:hypothetical protein
MSPDAWGHDKRRSRGDTVGVGGLGVGELDALPYHPAGFSFLYWQRQSVLQVNVQLFEIDMRFLTGDERLPDGWWYLGDRGASSGRRGLESHRSENGKLDMAQTQRKPHKSESRMHYAGGRSNKPFTQPPARHLFPPFSAPRQIRGSVRCLSGSVHMARIPCPAL